MALTSRIGAALAALVVWAPAWPATAAEPLATDALLARLIRESVEARPEIQRTAAAARADRERGSEAQVLPDPMLQIGFQNDGFSSITLGEMENSFVSFALSQTLPWPGKLPLKGEVAELSAKQREAFATRLRLSTEAEVRRAYLNLILARDRLALLDRIALTLDHVAQIAELRYSAAQGSQSELLRARLERSRLEERRLELERDAHAEEQRLNRLRAHPLAEPILTTAHLADLPLPEPSSGTESVEAARKRSPELTAARLGRLESERETALFERGNYPDFTVGAGLMYRGTSLPPMWGVSVAAPLPVFSLSRTEHAVAGGRARASANRYGEREVEQALALALAERRLLLKSELQQLVLYRERLLREAETVVASTLTQYSIGQAPFTAVLEANQAWLMVEDGYLERRARVERLRIADAELSLAPTAVPAPAAPAAGVQPSAGM